MFRVLGVYNFAPSYNPELNFTTPDFQRLQDISTLNFNSVLFSPEFEKFMVEVSESGLRLGFKFRD